MVVADISSEEDCGRVAAAAGGRVDVLVNCAGSFPICRFDDITAEAWRRIVDINLTGPFLMTKGDPAAHAGARLGSHHQLRLRLGVRGRAGADPLCCSKSRRCGTVAAHSHAWSGTTASPSMSWRLA